MEHGRILIIDDDKELSQLLGDTFKEHGCDIILASDGEEGIMKAKTEKPALILLDILMPKVDGMKVLETLHTADETKHIPVIILSNLGDMETISNTLVNNASDYLVKSDLDPETIVLKVKKKLEELKK